MHYLRLPAHIYSSKLLYLSISVSDRFKNYVNKGIRIQIKNRAYNKGIATEIGLTCNAAVIYYVLELYFIIIAFIFSNFK